MDYEFCLHGKRDVRTQLRQLIGQELPPTFLGAFTDDPDDLAMTQRFCRTLAERGLLAAAWPKEYGGGGADIWEQTAVREEMWAFHEPRGAQYMGINWVGPAIMHHGTPAQKRQHLPPIAGGEVIWCQGFSEPDAGSDLGALRTFARSEGDSWRISGQKIWTSYASMAQWCFLLARTAHNPDNKRDGITIFLVPMDEPGIEVRPIDSMVGPHHLNEVFFDEVPVTARNVLGEVGNGWAVILEALAYERVGIARYAKCERLLRYVPTFLADSWDDVDDDLKLEWARCLSATRRAQLLAYAAVAAQESGDNSAHQAASYRIAVTTLEQEVSGLMMELIGGDMITRDSQFACAAEDHWRYAQAGTVASGTIEMQRRSIGRDLVGAR